eukprot:SAG22_NODE_1011_length_6041_cov_11.536856_3_plen_117_part_00
MNLTANLHRRITDIQYGRAEADPSWSVVCDAGDENDDVPGLDGRAYRAEMLAKLMASGESDGTATFPRPPFTFDQAAWTEPDDERRTALRAQGLADAAARVRFLHSSDVHFTPARV